MDLVYRTSLSMDVFPLQSGMVSPLLPMCNHSLCPLICNAFNLRLLTVMHLYDLCRCVRRSGQSCIPCI